VAECLPQRSLSSASSARFELLSGRKRCASIVGCGVVRLASYAQSLMDSSAPVVLAGDFSVMPTELDFYAPERWG
jgi:hypothetical protein